MAGRASGTVLFGAPRTWPFYWMMDNPRALLASRYELIAAFESTRHTSGWVGFDVASGASVRVAAVDAGELGRYDKLIALRQLHLSGVLDVLRDVTRSELGPHAELRSTQALVVFEYVGGTTLHKYLQARGRVESFKAVAWVLRLIAALEAVHERGVPHGALNPRSVIVEPVGRVIPPVLLLASAPVLAAYCSPERVRGADPSIADDVWALLATAYRLVTGEAPFNDSEPRLLLAEVSRGRPRPIAELGVDDPELQRIFDVAFEPNERRRLSRLEDLKKALDRWERAEAPVVVPRAAPSRAVPRLGALTLGSVSAPSKQLVYCDRALPVDTGTVPAVPPAPGARQGAPSRDAASAPEASSVAEPSASSHAWPLPVSSNGSTQRGRIDSVAALLSARRMRRGRKSWLILGVPVVFAATGIAYVEFEDGLGFGGVDRRDRVQSDQAESAARPATRPAKGQGDRNGGNRAQRLARCVSSYFPAGVFDEGASFDSLCESGDFREKTTRLIGMARADRGASSDSGAAAESRAEGSADGHADGGVLVVKSSLNVAQQELDLGWYELVAVATARSGCCDNPPSIDLPETKGWCMQLEKAVRQVAEDSQKPGDLSPTIRAFDEAVECLFANQIPRSYAYELRPTPQQRAMLQRFLTRAAENEAKRSSGR